MLCQKNLKTGFWHVDLKENKARTEPNGLQGWHWPP